MDHAPTGQKPWQNPSYPQRVHIGERARWKGVLDAWQGRIDDVRRRLDHIAPGPKRAPYEKVYFQMCGARDQIAEAAARLPMEVDHMYHEDLRRLKEAVSALERLFARWDGGRL
ncbi:MAG: hypothetical protein U0800_13660 [Isosphaeraceae bacterium]